MAQFQIIIYTKDGKAMSFYRNATDDTQKKNYDELVEVKDGRLLELAKGDDSYLPVFTQGSP